MAIAIVPEPHASDSTSIDVIDSAGAAESPKVCAVGCRVMIRSARGTLGWHLLVEDQQTGAGRLPIWSALGRSLLGAAVGELVLPRGDLAAVEILAIEEVGR